MTYALRYMPDSPPPDDLAERNRRRRLRWEAAKKEYLAGETARVKRLEIEGVAPDEVARAFGAEP